MEVTLLRSQKEAGGEREKPTRGCSKHSFVFNRAVEMSEAKSELRHRPLVI